MTCPSTVRRAAARCFVLLLGAAFALSSGSARAASGKPAVRADADKNRFPRGWLFHRRWGRREGVRTVRGLPIHHETIAGRTTAWVPDVQA